MKNSLAAVSACFAWARLQSTQNEQRQTQNAQRGAMFGMDARIALIVAAILTAAGGITIMSQLESSKVQAAEMQTEQIKEGLNRYYTAVGINTLPENLDELFRAGSLTDPSLKRDPWGNQWDYSRTTATVRLEDTPITMQLAAVSSRGKDGVNNSAQINSENDFNEWQPGGDDIGTKYTSRDIEMARLAEYRQRAQLIIDKLEAMESASFLEAQNTCSAGTNIPDWCTNIDGKNYTLFNYYPKADSDDTSGVVYYSDKILNKKIYASGNLSEMQQLMVDLGLPAGYAQDPWGRVLMYSANVTGRTDPPFSASLCFSSGENCLGSAAN